MTRKWLAVLSLAPAACVAFAQDPEYREIPEEDEDLVQETDYAFNPIQAEKEVRVGDFYWKKKSYVAAAGRYREATLWNPRWAEAYWKLALAEQKVAETTSSDSEREVSLEQSIDALRKYLELEPDGKEAKKARRMIAEAKARASR